MFWGFGLSVWMLGKLFSFWGSYNSFTVRTRGILHILRILAKSSLGNYFFYFGLWIKGEMTELKGRYVYLGLLLSILTFSISSTVNLYWADKYLQVWDDIIVTTDGHNTKQQLFISWKLLYLQAMFSKPYIIYCCYYFQRTYISS